jgi:threonine/homoserine efflux transporter RhtA
MTVDIDGAAVAAVAGNVRNVVAVIDVGDALAQRLDGVTQYGIRNILGSIVRFPLAVHLMQRACGSTSTSPRGVL